MNTVEDSNGSPDSSQEEPRIASEVSTLSPPETAEGGKIGFLTEGILLVIVSTAAYLCCYFYELAYCRHFGIPAEFISITTSNLLWLAVAILGLIGVFTQMIVNYKNFIDMVDPDSLSLCRLFINKHGIMLSLMVILVSTNGMEWWMWFTMVLIPVVFVPMDFLFAALYRSTDQKCGGEHKSYSSYLREQFSEPHPWKESKKRPMTKTDVVFSYFLLSMLFVGFCYMLGRGKAVTTATFPFIGENGRQIVLRRYGDQLVTATYDPEVHKVLPNYRLFSVADLDEPVVVRTIGVIEAVEASPMPMPVKKKMPIGGPVPVFVGGQ